MSTTRKDAQLHTHSRAHKDPDLLHHQIGQKSHSQAHSKAPKLRQPAAGAGHLDCAISDTCESDPERLVPVKSLRTGDLIDVVGMQGCLFVSFVRLETGVHNAAELTYMLPNGCVRTGRVSEHAYARVRG